MGSVSFDVDVPKGTEALWISYWSKGSELGDGAAHYGVHLAGCQDYTSTTADYGASFGRYWCENPTTGKGTVTWTLQAGFITGRVCVMIAPHMGDPDDCRFFV